MNNIEIEQLSNRIYNFLARHRTEISEIASHASNVFEAACFVIFAIHYEEAGYRLRPENLLEGRFRFRYSTSGYPWNFSYFAVLANEIATEGNAVLFEIRHNQKVVGAWVDTEGESEDKALFAVDIAVIETGSLPDLSQGHKRTNEPYWVENDRLITFAEAKKLTAYPMLLAQFLGIVHEIKPEFLRVGKQEIPEMFWSQSHPPPTLLTANHLTQGTKKVLQSFEERQLVIRVVENVIGSPEEILLCRLRGVDEQEAFDQDEESREVEMPETGVI